MDETIFSEYVARKAAAKKLDIKKFLMKLAGEASEIKLITHAGKFTNPSVVKLDLYCDRNASRALDGYCYTSVNSVTDGIGSLRVISTVAFLGLILEDGRSVYYHLSENSETVKSAFMQLGFSNEEYDVIRKMFMEARPVLPPLETTRLLKQVYFPIADGGYHVLSIINSSAFLKRISDRISDFTSVWDYQESKKGKGKHWGEPFQGISNVTEIHVGGANPQNVSGLNVLNAGKFLMLPSLPPFFRKFRRFPRNNFFNNYFWKEKADMEILHKALLSYKRKNNLAASDSIRAAADSIIENMFSVIIYFQGLDSGWSDHPKCNIPVYQKILLDSKYSDMDIKKYAGMEKKAFYDRLSGDMLYCIISCYNYLFKGSGVDDETEELKKSKYAVVISDDVKDILYKRCKTAFLC